MNNMEITIRKTVRFLHFIYMDIQNLIIFSKNIYIFLILILIKMDNFDRFSSGRFEIDFKFY